MQSTNTIGEVDVNSNFRMMQRLEGVYVTANKDSQTLIVEYDDNSTYSALNPVQLDVRKMLAPGDLFRVGGTGEGDGTSQSGMLIFAYIFIHIYMSICTYLQILKYT